MRVSLSAVYYVSSSSTIILKFELSLPLLSTVTRTFLQLTS